MEKYHEEALSFFNNQQNLFKLLIITATEIEKQSLHKRLLPLPGKNLVTKVYHGKQTYYLGIFGKYRAIHVACGEMGSSGRAASIVTTTDAISFCKPEIVIMIGIAFGIDKRSQGIGDVLVSERIISYEPQRIGTVKTEFRGKESPASSMLVNRFQNVDWSYQVGSRIAKIIVGDVLSGEKLLDNRDAKDELVKQYPNAKGGEMEGVGIASACDGKVNSWIVVKAICDYADGRKKIGKAKKQTIAAASAVNLCECFFSSEHALSGILVPHYEQNGSKKMTEEIFAISKKQIENDN